MRYDFPPHSPICSTVYWLVNLPTPKLHVANFDINWLYSYC